MTFLIYFCICLVLGYLMGRLAFWMWGEIRKKDETIAQLRKRVAYGVRPAPDPTADFLRSGPIPSEILDNEAHRTANAPVPVNGNGSLSFSLLDNPIVTVTKEELEALYRAANPAEDMGHFKDDGTLCERIGHNLNAARLSDQMPAKYRCVRCGEEVTP